MLPESIGARQRRTAYPAALALLSLLATVSPVASQPVGPTLAKKTEAGMEMSGPLTLRPSDEVRNVVASAWPGFDPHFTVPVARADALPAAVADALAYARAELKKKLDALRSIPDGLEWNQLTDEHKAAIDGFADTGWTAIDILLAVGEIADADWLYETAQAINSSGRAHYATYLQRSASRMWQRLGVLDKSMLSDDFRAALERNDGATSGALAIFLSELGHREATRHLSVLVASAEQPSTAKGYDHATAFKLVAGENDPAVMSAALRVLEFYRDYAEDIAAGRQADNFRNGIAILAELPHAFLHVAAFGDQRQREALNLAFVSGNTAPQIAPAFVDPVPPYLHWLRARYGERYPENKFNVTYENICLLHAGRARSQSEEIKREVIAGIAGLVIEAFNHANPLQFAGYAEDLGRAICDVNPPVLSFLKAPEHSRASNIPIFMRYPFDTLDGLLGGFAEGKSKALWGRPLDEMPDARFDREVSAASYKDEPAMVAYRKYRSVATRQGMIDLPHFGGDTMYKRILMPVDPQEAGGQTPQWWLDAKVSITPRHAGGSWYFGLALDTAFRNDWGLAGLIMRVAEAHAAMAAEFGKPLIEKAVLRRGGASTTLDYVQTTENGLHVFRLPDGDTGDENLVVDVHLRAFDADGNPLARRIVSFPLNHSPFGYRRMRESGRILATGAEGN